MAGLRRNLVFGRGGALGGGFGGGGGDPFGAIGGFINSMGWNPELEQAKQLQALKIQAAQQQLQARQQAQQQEQETMAEFRKLGEDIVPEAGTEVPTEAQGPGAGQVLGTFAGEPTANDRLLRAMIQSGNPALLAKVQAQFAPQEPQPQGTVEEISGQRFTRDINGNLHPIPTKEPREQEEIRNVYAMSKYGSPFNQLQPDKQMDVLQTIESHKGETAVAQAVNRQTALMPGMLAAASAKRGEQPAPPRVYLDQTGQEQHPGTVDEAKGLTALPISSPAAKTHTASNMVYNHLALGIDNLNGIAGGDRNRLIQNLDNKISVFKNDPAAVALFHFLGPATAVALSNAYAANSAGMRGGARLAMIMRSAGIEEGDTLRTAIQSKLLPLATLNLANVRDAGLPTQKYEEQIKALNNILQSKPGVTGPPPPGTKWQRNTRTGEIRAMPIGQ